MKPLDLSGASYYPWIALVLALISHGGFSMSGLGLTPLYPFIQEDFSLSRAQVGLITGALFGAAAFTSFLFGWACDRFGVRMMAGPFMVISGLVMMSLSLAPGYVILLLIAVVAGFMQSLGHPAGAKAVVDWIRPALRGAAISIKQAGNPAAGAVAALLLPPIAVAFGWRMAVVALGGLIILGGLSVLALYRDRPRDRGQAASSGRVWADLRWVVGDRDIWLSIGYAFPMVAAQISTVTYFILFLTDDLLVSVVAAGGMLAALQVSSIVWRISWGVVSDTLWRGRRVPVLGAIALLSTGVLLGLAFLPVGTPFWTLILMAVALGATVMAWVGVHTVLVAELGGPGRVGAAVGYVSTAQRLVIVVAPPLFGLLADVTGSYQLSWLAMVGAAAISSLFLLPIKERRRTL